MLLFLFFSCLSIFFSLLFDGVGYYDIVWQHIGILCSQDEFISYLMFMPQVLSINLDEWTDEQVDTLVDMGGNDAANLKYEACIPDNLRKPKPDSSIDERSDYIR